MSERVPLRNGPKGKKNDYKAASDEQQPEEYYYEDEEFELSPRVRIGLYAVGGLFSLAILFFFAFYLPNMFIPESRDIEGIIKLGELQATLSPITVAREAELGLWRERGSEENEEGIEDESIEEEEEEHLQSSHKRKVERLIMVGDIHGHYIEFRKLLRKIKFNKKKDQLLVLGDFISKGPDSIKVLNYLIENNIDCILGNHEYYALQNYAQFHRLDAPEFVKQRKTEQVFIRGQFNDDPEYLLAKKLQPNHVEYINNCPVIKTLGQVPLYKPTIGPGRRSCEGVAVHAGLRWDLTDDLLDQDPVECLEMRSLIGPFFNESSDDPHVPLAVSWSKIWNQKQKEVAKTKTGKNYVVYYGHDARRELNLKKYAKGLDTGCDSGKLLTATVIWTTKAETTGKVKYNYNERIVSVSCS